MKFGVASLVRRFRASFGALRERMNPYRRIAALERRFDELNRNMYYEMESPEVWRPNVMGLEETLRYIVDRRCSVARFGDGEFELVDGRHMSFEGANPEMRRRLVEILENPIAGCLCCIPDIFGSLAHYSEVNRLFWRRAALWMRPLAQKHLSAGCESMDGDRVLGDALVSRPYLGQTDKAVAPRAFALWKDIFAGKNILIVEGRFSRLGIGNDLFAGAKSIRRIWCPPLGAFAKYREIKEAVMSNSGKCDLVLLALGATATILAYDLAKEGLWAVDAGHLDVEYMWMKIGAETRVPIPGRYVNECAAGGREMKKIPCEEAANNVVAVIGGD